MTKEKDMEKSIIHMKENHQNHLFIQETLKTIKNMVLELIFIKMGHNMKETMKMVCKMDRESMIQLMMRKVDLTLNIKGIF